MALLLDRRGDKITVTEEVVKAAAGNIRKGKKLMALLLDRRGDEILVTEEVAKAGLCIAKFYNAAKAGDVCCIEQLIREGTKPDTKNIRGESPLWIAAAYGHEAVVEVLAQRADVNVNSMSISRRSPLFWPSSEGYERVVAILMEAGADPDLVDENGDTALTVARRNGYEGIAKILERSGENKVEFNA
jgi:ankyrin repeat protein